MSAARFGPQPSASTPWRPPLRAILSQKAERSNPAGVRDRAVRFAVASEMNAPAENSQVANVRFKQRTTFVHKRMFKFELTKVRVAHRHTPRQAAR